jgi:hypothetical protein
VRAQAARRATRAACGRTGGVSELVLLPFYSVLEGLGIAPCDLDLLLDRLLIHIGHATLRRPDVGGRVARRAERRGRQSRGRCRGRSRPDTERRLGQRADDGNRGAQTRRAEAIACAEGATAGSGRGGVWMGAVQAECWR